MLKQIKLRPVYFFAVLSLLCVCIFFSLSFSKTVSFQLFNQYHNNLLDVFFINLTLLGDGLLSVIVVAVLFFLKKYKEGFILLAAFISSGLLACLFKNIFSLPRPKLYFEQLHINYYNFLDGVTLSNFSSFPSGHTASAFAMATVIALLSNKKSTSLIVVLAALLIGYSRMYLGQHFLQDVTAGAFLGIVCAMYFYYLIHQKQFNPFNNWKRNKFTKNKEMQPQWN